MKKIQPTWIIVIGVNNTTEDVYMISKKNEQGAMDFIKTMSEEDTLEGLFTVNNFGEVKHYKVIWDGRLKIEERFL